LTLEVKADDALRGLMPVKLEVNKLAVNKRRCESTITAYGDGSRGPAKLVGGTEESHWPLRRKLMAGLLPIASQTFLQGPKPNSSCDIMWAAPPPKEKTKRQGQSGRSMLRRYKGKGTIRRWLG